MPLPLLGSREAARGRVTSSDRSQEWKTVVLDVGVRLAGNPLDSALLSSIAHDEPLQCPGTLGDGGASEVPRLEEALRACDDEAAQARLEVDDELLELVRGHERFARIAPQLRGLAQVADREQQHRERHTEKQRQQPARRDHAKREASGHRGPSLQRAHEPKLADNYRRDDQGSGGARRDGRRQLGQPRAGGVLAVIAFLNAR